MPNLQHTSDASGETHRSGEAHGRLVRARQQPDFAASLRRRLDS